MFQTVNLALKLIIVLAISVVSSERISAEVSSEFNHAVIDGVKIPYAAPIEVIGECVEVDYFDLSHGVAALKGARINGRANQDKILFHLHTSHLASRKTSKEDPALEALKAMKPGEWYKLRGVFADGNAVGPTPKFSFVVERCDAVPPAPIKMSDFIDREANMEGRAEKGGVLRVDGETASLDPPVDWPEKALGKTISVRGVLRRDEKNGLKIERAEWKLVELEDQLNDNVSLEGRLWSLNDHWWFEYRGVKLYLTNAKGRLPRTRYAAVTAPGGHLRMDPETMVDTKVQAQAFEVNSRDHGRRVRVFGTLVRQLRPSLDQITLKTDRDLVPCYTIRNAKIEYLDPRVSWYGKFRTLFATPFRFVDGVPELIPEYPIRRNILGNETKTSFFHQRNGQAIAWTLCNATPQTLDVLAKRMADETVERPLRLWYAAMLAAANDQRGRKFLLKAVETQDTDELADALYCLGAAATLMPSDSPLKINTDMTWAEPTMIAVMSRRDDEGNLVGGRIASGSTRIPEILARLNTPASRRALIDYAISVEEADYYNTTLQMLCDQQVLLSDDDLMRLAAAAKNQYSRTSVLSQFLRKNHPDTVKLFLNDLNGGFMYMDFRDHLTPEIVAALKSHIDRMSGEAKIHAQMLVVLGEKDPVPALIGLLKDPKWTDKNLVLFELARLKDSRAVAPIAKILREAPANYLQTDSELTAGAAIGHALDAIAGTESKEAVAELIRLMPVDLDRLGTYHEPGGYRRIIAAHLIELTGESFGVDADAWRKWNKSRQ